MYEQLKAVPDRTALQERLVLLVHLKKKQIRVREMEILTIGLANEENAKGLESLMGSYRKMHFPGATAKEEVKDEQLDQAKRLLAEAAKTVLIVRPLLPGENLPDGATSSPQMAALHARHITEAEQKRVKEAQRAREKGRFRKRGRK
jgi:DNA repair photolyase